MRIESNGSVIEINSRMTRILYTLQRAWEAGAKAPFADVLHGAGADSEDLERLRLRGLVNGQHVPLRGDPWMIEDFTSWAGGYADTIVFLTTAGRGVITSGPFRLLRAVSGGRGRRADLCAAMSHVGASLVDAGQAGRLRLLEIRHGLGGPVLDEAQASAALRLQAHRPSEAAKAKIAKMSEARREELRQPLYLYTTAHGRACIPGLAR